MPLASLEERESDKAMVSIDSDRVYDIVREGYITIVEWYVLCLNIVYTLVFKIYISSKCTCW